MSDQSIISTVEVYVSYSVLEPQALHSASLAELSATISSKPHLAQELFTPQQHSLGWPANWRKIRFTRRNGWREAGDERLLRGSCYCQKVREPSFAASYLSRSHPPRVVIGCYGATIWVNLSNRRAVAKCHNVPLRKKRRYEFAEVERGERMRLQSSTDSTLESTFCLQPSIKEAKCVWTGKL